MSETRPGRTPALLHRSSRTVLAAHLRLRTAGNLERDLRENYSPDVVVLTAPAVVRGREGVRRSAHRLWLAAQTIHYRVEDLALSTTSDVVTANPLIRDRNGDL